MKKRLTIAIDGYSGCGKSTLAKDLAQSLNYVFIDTGAMYRGVTLFALQNGYAFDEVVDEEGLIEELDKVHLEFKLVPPDERAHLFLNGIDEENVIRAPEVASYVSKVAAIPEVREKLVAEQRLMGKSGGVVMDGRDIGSVVFPNADLKLFVTARPEVRAQRRLRELKDNGIDATLEEVIKNLQERDQIDTTRKESPLVRVADAILLDTSDFTREGQLLHVLQLIKKRF